MQSLLFKLILEVPRVVSSSGAHLPHSASVIIGGRPPTGKQSSQQCTTPQDINFNDMRKNERGKGEGRGVQRDGRVQVPSTIIPLTIKIHVRLNDLLLCRL